MKLITACTMLFAFVCSCISMTPVQSAPAYVVKDLTVGTELCMSNAFAINDNGVISGRRFTSSSWKAFSWTDSTGWKSLGELPQCDSSEAIVINNSGTIAGASYRNEFYHGVVWENGQSIRDLETIVTAGGKMLQK